LSRADGLESPEDRQTTDEIDGTVGGHCVDEVDGPDQDDESLHYPVVIIHTAKIKNDLEEFHNEEAAGDIIYRQEKTG
jgi:hypothetical protein